MVPTVASDNPPIKIPDFILKISLFSAILYFLKVFAILPQFHFFNNFPIFSFPVLVSLATKKSQKDMSHTFSSSARLTPYVKKLKIH